MASKAPAAAVIGLYERHAAAFARDRAAGGWPDRVWHERFAAKLPKGACVLDIGCGAGMPVAGHLAARGLRVTGVDSAPSMVAMCRARLPDHEWIVADMRLLSLGRRFDAILAWDSFFHLAHDDQRAMLGVLAAHAAPAALLMLNTGPAHGEAIGTWQGEPLYHASLDAAEYRLLLDRAGFDVEEHVAEDPDAGGRTVWLARRRGP